jgi:hypothetical protein
MPPSNVAGVLYMGHAFIIAVTGFLRHRNKLFSKTNCGRKTIYVCLDSARPRRYYLVSFPGPTQ